MWGLWQSWRPGQLRKLIGWGLGCLWACSGGTSGDHYLAALDPTVSLEGALKGCERLRTLDARGDCATAAVEIRGSVSQDACQGVPSGLWREECSFMLAERQRGAGLLAEGLDSCLGIRFGRECTFHLIRAEAWEVLDLPSDQAAVRLAGLHGLPHARDAERLFWREWHHRGLVLGRSVDPERCEGLADPDVCRGVVGELFRDAAATLGWPEVCERAARGQTLLTRAGGEPAYLPSPEVDGWVARSCEER